MSIRYVHLPEGKDEHIGDGISAHWREDRLPYQGREVFYLTTEAVVDTICCGDRVFYFASVLGYILSWQKEHSEAGLPVSEMEPITDAQAQQEIEDVLHQQYPLLQVEFRQS